MNHFIEFSQSRETGSLWATVHSGSRQFGKQICQYWQNAPRIEREEEAKEALKKGIAEIRKTCKGKDISDGIKQLRKDLGIGKKVSHKLDFLTGEYMYGYLTDMIFTSIYAKENRRAMGKVITQALKTAAVQIIETVHNYIDFKDMMIRKGAVAAHEGEDIIIPFNMEDGILLCKGKGNKDWNYSAPHGAGRVMSRSKAKEDCSAEVAAERMKDKDIYTSAIPVDEVKEAYKDPKVIEAAIGPTVSIIERLRPILNMKEGGKDDGRNKSGTTKTEENDSA